MSIKNKQAVFCFFFKHVNSKVCISKFLHTARLEYVYTRPGKPSLTPRAILDIYNVILGPYKIIS